jgi:hypothetical protein
MNEKDIINLYRQQMENHSEQAPEGLWDDIADQLDVDDVWDNISAELDQDEKKKPLIFPWLLRAAMIAGIVSILGIGVWFGLPGGDEPQLADNPSLPIISESDDATETLPPILENAEDNSLQTESAGESAARFSNSSGLASNVVSESTSQIGTTEISGDGRQISYSSADFLQTGIFSETLKELPSEKGGLLALESDDKYPGYILFTKTTSAEYIIDAPANSLGFQAANNEIPGTFSLGFSSAVKNTWMFNSETFEGLDRLNHNRTGLKVYPDLGLSMQYQFSQRWGIESDIFFASVTGQLYHQYIHGKYTERNISLQYFQTEFLASYTGRTRLFRQTNPLKLKSMLGVYSSRLYSARETIGSQNRDVRNRYQNMDFGLIAGQHVDFNIGENFIVSPGLRVKWGLSDIYSGSPQGFSSLSNTHNRSFEFRLNVYYRFSR